MAMAAKASTPSGLLSGAGSTSATSPAALTRYVQAFGSDTITDGMKSIKGSVFWMAPEVIKVGGAEAVLQL
jgi:hypothetical protein